MELIRLYLFIWVFVCFKDNFVSLLEDTFGVKGGEARDTGQDREG